MAIDPICNMTVDKATARSAERDGQTFYFCSEHCRQKFVESGEPSAESPAPQSLHSQPSTLHPQPSTLHSQPSTLHPQPSTLHPQPSTLHPQPSTLHPRLYTCPMHPEIEQAGPGTCPICGMDLEPKYLDAEEEDDSELRNMTLRFWVGVALSLPVFLLAMLPMVGVPIDVWVGRTVDVWLQLILSTPVVLWSGWPFFVRGFRSIVTWNLIESDLVNGNVL